ncbi:MAG: hypothetical protein NC314_04350 [Roseburia sp.]|nr:hypothetical protein [Roseburia sp.]MCM1242050.1 hypothetical protein [Roseburia sp.]
MSEKTENKQKSTVCNLETMFSSYMELTSIQTALYEAYEQAATLATDFSESYEGEAKDEVVLFLENLPLHIYKLSLFYGKMAQFVSMTGMSFMTNDQIMAGRLEG